MINLMAINILVRGNSIIVRERLLARVIDLNKK